MLVGVANLLQLGVRIAVLATWVIRSENRHYENGIPSPQPLGLSV
jgi:hypothetical protein